MTKEGSVKLSLIICVYNTKRHYVEECLFSVVNSTLSFDQDNKCGIEYEICMVDDGSDTDYSDIVEKYGIRYKKTENRGILSARLTGMEMAKGEYIAFVDSDDTVSCNYHRSLLVTAEHGYDIVFGDWAFMGERSRYYCVNDGTMASDISAEGKNVLSRFFEREGREHSYYVMWNKIYRRECLEYAAKCISDGTPPRGFTYSEDTLINFYAFAYAARITNIHTGYYFYRIHPDQTVKASSEERIRFYIGCMSYSFSAMREYCLRHGLYQYTDRIESWEGLMARTHYSYAKGGGYDGLYEVIKGSYRVEKNEVSRRSDGTVYEKTKLLPDNVTEIDAAIMYAVRKKKTVCLSKNVGEYTEASIMGMVKSGFRITVSDGGYRIPKEKIRFINRLVHNPFIYRISAVLFPKGSRIRAFLKSKF